MTDKEKCFVSAVVYVHNAENRIYDFLGTIIRTMEDNFEHSEIICVNDSSEDGALKAVKRASTSALKTSVSIINMSYFHGLELSMNAGVDMSIGDFVFEFDNTYLDFEPSVIIEIYRRSLEGYDIVSASASRKEMFSSMLFYKIFGKYTDFSHKMTTESFRVLSRRVINRIGSMNKTVPYRKAVYAGCGLKTDNIKYNITNQIPILRDKKEKDFRFNLAVDSLILFTNVGYSFGKTMTILMMFISIFMTLYSIFIYITRNPVAGWTTIVLFLSVAFFGVFGILTVVIKYLQLLIDLVFRRKHYSIESVEKLTK